MFLKSETANGGYSVIEVSSVAFTRDSSGHAYAEFVDSKGTPGSVCISGRAFVLNDNGQTVDVFDTTRATNGQKNAEGRT